MPSHQGYPQIEKDRLRYVDSRFKNHVTDSSQEIVLDLVFESLMSQWIMYASMKSTDIPGGLEPGRAEVLARTASYVSSRLSDAFVRWFSFRWLQSQFAMSAGGISDRWRALAKLSIKDLHSDIASTMDALASFILRLEGERYHLKGWGDWLPSFGQLIRREGSKPRQRLSSTCRDLVDEAKDWYPFVKRIRDSLLHKRSLIYILSSPPAFQGFQINLQPDEPTITAEPLLLQPAGGPIVDFSLYGVWMLAETMFFMDQTAGVAMEMFKINESLLPEGRIVPRENEFRRELRRLLERIDEAREQG